MLCIKIQSRQGFKRAGHRVNQQTARMIQPAWFNHLVETLFLTKKFSSNSFEYLQKPIAFLLNKLNETPARSVLFLVLGLEKEETTKYISMHSDLPGKSSSKSVSYSELVHVSPSKMLWNEGEARVVTV